MATVEKVCPVLPPPHIHISRLQSGLCMAQYMFAGRLVVVLSYSLSCLCLCLYSSYLPMGLRRNPPLPTSCCALREKTQQQVSDRLREREKH